MNNLLSVLLSTLKARIVPFWTRLKYWTSWSYIKANVLTKIRNALSGIFQVKPRDKNDYYLFFNYLVSKRLAHAAVVVAGILCFCYFAWVNPIVDIGQGVKSGEKIYAYNSIPLRFAKGNVKIRAASGYIAYEGNVESGYAAGTGQLFDKDGALVYRGNFEKNKFCKQGTLYYPIGQKQYEGEFLDNCFEGEGTLYRESGSRYYQGGFSKGVFEGEGTLYDASDADLFHGTFRSGEIVYPQLLGKSASEISEMYSGKQLIYQYGTDTAVILDGIGAFYVSPSNDTSISDEYCSSVLYVGKDEFVCGDRKITTLAELRSVLGTPVFEGNSYLTFPEAVGINWLKKKGKEIDIEADIKAVRPFDEVWELESYDTDVLVYLYVFQTEDVSYTFIAEEKDSDFFMYAVE